MRLRFKSKTDSSALVSFTLYLSSLLVTPVVPCTEQAPRQGQIVRSLWVRTDSHLEVGLSGRSLGPEGEMAAFHDHVGQLQFGGCLPVHDFFHGVSADQTNDFNRPVHKSNDSSV